MFNTYCTNKGCGQYQAPYLDPDNNTVYCSVCDKSISNLTSFAINQMKSNKQFKVKKSTPFAVKCQSCKKEDIPLLNNNKLLCSSCKKELTNLSEPFKILIKEKLKAPNNE